MKSTSVEVSWRGNGQAPTTVRYDCIFKETGLVVSQSEVTMQPRVTSTVISVCVGDTVPEYQHKVTLIQKTPSGDDQVNKTFDLGITRKNVLTKSVSIYHLQMRSISRSSLVLWNTVSIGRLVDRVNNQFTVVSRTPISGEEMLLCLQFLYQHKRVLSQYLYSKNEL